MKCKSCSRESGKKDFCQLHSKAYENLVLAYVSWRKGLRISWEDYLGRIRESSLTGTWAKEVAEYLISEEEQDNVEKG